MELMAWGDGEGFGRRTGCPRLILNLIASTPSVRIHIPILGAVIIAQSRLIALSFHPWQFLHDRRRPSRAQRPQTVQWLPSECESEARKRRQ